MNPTDDSTLKDRIRQITDGLSRDRFLVQADNAKDVAASLGTETPITVLSDIRNVNSRVLETLKGMHELSLETERNAERRHKEMCTLLIGSIQSNASSSANAVVHSLSHTVASTTGKEKYYYGSTTLSSGPHVIGCIMMHLDILLSEHPQFEKLHMSDKTFMDIKDWCVAVTYILNADKCARGGLRVPKPIDEDFKSVCRMLAASAPGRRPRCEVSHLNTLLTETPGIMNTVEWTKNALIKCKGVLSPERELRFKYLEYPFVGGDTELALKPLDKIKLPSRSLHRDVAELKATQKKQYMNMILEKDVSYMSAINELKKTT